VASLVAICDAIGLRIGSLFEPPRSDLVRRADRQRIDVGGIGVTDYLLSAESDSRIQVLESHIEPGGGGGGEPRSVNSAAEFVHVVAGELEVRMHNRAYRLYSGDSLTFSPRDVHSWRNPSEDDTAVVFWVLMPSPW
jgi:quercetin dioxygenase-like cupin family protein